MRKKVRKSLAFLLALALVVSVMSGLGLSVSADDAQNEPVAAVAEGEQTTPAEEKPKAEESTPEEGEKEEEKVADPDAEPVQEGKKDEQKAAGEGSGDSSAADPIEPADEPSADENGTDVTTLTEEQQAQYKMVYDQIMACTDADELAKLLKQYGEDELFGIYVEQYLRDEEKAAWNAKINAPATLADVTVNKVEIVDTVTENGRLTLKATDAAGNEITAEKLVEAGYTIEWKRKEPQEAGSKEEIVQREKKTGDIYNMPENTAWVNVAYDNYTDSKGKEKKTGAQCTYTVTVTKEGSTALNTSKKVEEYDALQNGTFETPASTDNYQPFIESGEQNIVWKTTATSTKNGRTHKYIELISVSNDRKQKDYSHADLAARWHGLTGVPEGVQCAELNADAAGALYQDVLTTPGSTMNWRLYHCARWTVDRDSSTSWNNKNAKDTMYVLIMPTNVAETNNVTTQEKVNEVIDDIQDGGTKYSGSSVVEITDGIAWTEHSGKYKVPDNQYQTRYFFVAGQTQFDKDGKVTENDPAYTIGNNIDNVWFSTELPPPAPDKGNLKVTKTVTGLSELPEDYTVTMAKGTSESDKITFRKDDFKQNTNGTFTAESQWSDLSPDNYTVTETVSTTVDGYDLSTTYTVDAGDVQSGSSATATVAANKTTTVAFTNTYTPSNRTITLKKVVDGNMGDTNKGFKFSVSGGNATITKDTLKHYEETTITAKVGQEITITEDNYTSDGYTTTASATNDVKDGKYEDHSYTFTVTKDMSTSTVITFTNTKTIQPPNGITTNATPYIIMVVLAAGAAVYFVYSRRRRNG